MSTRRICILIAVGLTIAASGSAFAADMAVKAPPPTPTPVYNWTGFYVGGNLGADWTRNSESVSGTPGPCSAALGGCTATPNYSTLMASGLNQVAAGGNRTAFIGGAQIGYNWQFSPTWVAGLEADIQGLSSNGSSTSSVLVIPSTAFPAFPVTQTFNDSQKLKYLGTVRGRVGVLTSPAFLFYATGGLAYGGISARTTITEQIAPPDPSIPASGSGGSSTTRAGYTVGAGAEWMFAPNWTVKAEYLYYNLGTVSYSIPLAIVSTALPGAVTGSATANISDRFTGNIFRVGLNYQFH